MSIVASYLGLVPIKTIKSVKIKSSKNKIEIEIKSQSFLQQQVRSMVGWAWFGSVEFNGFSPLGGWAGQPGQPPRLII